MDAKVLLSVTLPAFRYRKGLANFLVTWKNKAGIPQRNARFACANPASNGQHGAITYLAPGEGLEPPTG